MKITLTGTPGTGKTTVAKKMPNQYHVVHLTDFLEKHAVGEVVDGEREVPIQEMKTQIKNEDLPAKTLIEGHLAHHIESDCCIVLRCQPEKLKERLSERDYSEQKINENVEAETLDIILSEALKKQEKVIEVNTTGNTVSGTIEQIEYKIEEGEIDYGNVDWTEFL